MSKHEGFEQRLVRVVNRKSGYVMEGAELTPGMVIYAKRNPEHFRMFYDEDEEEAAVAVAAATITPPGKSLVTTYTLSELMAFTADSLKGIAEELGIPIPSGSIKRDVVDLILESQSEP